jgi:gliding motility associated protien GldN
MIIKIMRNLYCILLIFISGCISAQTVSPTVLDGVYIRENNFQKKTMAYNFESEAKLMWSKRIWRVLDLREKINHPFYYPIQPTRSMRNLVTVIRESLCAGELSAYDVMSDEFLYLQNSGEACKLGEKVDTIFQPDENGNLVPIPINDPFPTENVRRFRIKEDWFFDNSRGVMEARVIGICPIEEAFDELGEYKGERPLYWIYMPELRHIIANSPAPNPHNDAERRTYDDLFNKRRFSSYIYQESNVYGRKISDYKQDLALLLEGKKIEHEIFTFEQDLWEY